MMEWQPIETAPNGKDVLLAVQFDGPNDWRIKCGSYYNRRWHVCGASWIPTHWMPLPKPPVDDTCRHCGGSGWVVRDPDIGTDMECFVCDGSGHYSD